MRECTVVEQVARFKGGKLGTQRSTCLRNRSNWVTTGLECSPVAWIELLCSSPANHTSLTERSVCGIPASKSSSAVSLQLQKVDSPVTTPPHHPPPSSYDMIGTVQAACNVRIVIERSIISWRLFLSHRVDGALPIIEWIFPVKHSQLSTYPTFIIEWILPLKIVHRDTIMYKPQSENGSHSIVHCTSRHYQGNIDFTTVDIHCSSARVYFLLMLMHKQMKSIICLPMMK